VDYPEAPSLREVGEVREWIASRLGDEIWRAQDSFQHGLYLVVKSLSRSPQTPAGMAILNHASNDALDLIGECLRGEGRPAARAARALFEHDVNLASILAEPSLDARYLEHELVAAEILGKRAPGLSRLKGKRMRMKRAEYREFSRRAKQYLPALVEKYGSSYRRTWSSTNLRDRASRLGVDGYEGYQWLSGVLHGSSGGLIGTLRSSPPHLPKIHRLGPSLELASLAYLEGLESFRRTVERLPAVRPGTDISVLLRAVDDLLAAWPMLDGALAAADEKMWPGHTGQHFESVLALYPRGHRWYVVDHESGAMGLALAPEGESDFVASVRGNLAEQIAHYDPASFEGRPLSLNVTELMHLEPRPDALWFAAESVLVPRRLQPDRPHIGALKGVEPIFYDPPSPAQVGPEE